MLIRDKVLRYYKSSGDNEIALKLLDLVEMVLKNKKYKVSNFLDPYEINIAETIASQYDNIKLVFSNEIGNYERLKVAYVYSEYLGEIDFDISAVKIIWNGKYHTISHRDILGAILSSGVKREVIGDIIVDASFCHILVHTPLKDFIMQNLNTIGSATISIEEISLNEVLKKEEKVKEIRSTVSSLRLDSVAAVGFGISRTKMSDEISSEKVKVNWQIVKSSSYIVKQSDIISFRGKGRVEVCEILGQTKKGRLSILVKRFL